MKNAEVDREKAMRDSLIATLDLMEFGIRLMRQNIARKLSGAEPSHIDAELSRWLFEQPVDFIPQMPSSSPTHD